jgi:acid phosphatase
VYRIWLAIVAAVALALTVPAGSAPARPASAGPASAGPASAGPASAGPASAGPASAGPASARPAAGTVHRFDHVVIAIFENHQYGSVINNPNAPYLSGLAGQGANFTQSFAITHPSQPNYLALFSGSTQGVTNDSCPHTFSGASLGSQLTAAGRTFTGYSESMPSDGFTGCTSGRYARKHNPWADFSAVSAAANLRYTRFPTSFDSLPTLSFVVPNLCDDMHDCSVATGDSWARANLDGYAQWAKTHNSLLIVTFDEDDSAGNNMIPTVFVGQSVRTGDAAEHIDHYTVLRTLEDMYGLAALGNAATRTAITDIWT